MLQKLTMLMVTVLALSTYRAVGQEKGKTSPLADAVKEFNQRAQKNVLGKAQPALTEDEVIAAIRGWNRERIPASPEVYKAYQTIADTKELPEGATLTFTTKLRDANGDEFDVWWINLDIKTGPNSGYAFRIRDKKLWPDDKVVDGKNPLSPKEQFAALLKELSAKQRQIQAEAQKAKGKERETFLQYRAVTQDFAKKAYKIAADNPKDPITTEVLFWVVQHGSGTARNNALNKVSALVGTMPLPDLLRQLRPIRFGSPALMEAVFKRAEKETEEPQAADLLAWVAMNGGNLPVGEKAFQALVERYPEHTAIEQLCAMLARGNNVKNLATFRQLLEKSSNPRVQSAAALALGQALSAEADRLGDDLAKADKVAEVAEQLLVMAIDKAGKDDSAKKRNAERELQALRTLRVGKVAPEIAAGDLDEKKFKLSDYRGKVVLLDFWGNW